MTIIDVDYHSDVKISPNKLPTEITLIYPIGSVSKGFETTFRKRFPQSSNSNAHRMECNSVVGEPMNDRSNIPFKPNDSGASVEEVFFLSCSLIRECLLADHSTVVIRVTI